jgi:hypothetical protein
MPRPPLSRRSLAATVLAAAPWLALVVVATHVSAAPPERVRFNAHVRPILSQNCFFCHGPDEKHREADLRLDERAAATADLGGYAAIVPGKPDESALVERICSTDDEQVMPPPKSKKPRLSADDVATLRLWIEQGAEYENHWSLLPLSREAPPEVKDQSWVQNPIDQFILARLDAEGLPPSPAADRSTLIRRVYLDLVGLLPPPDDVERFVKDEDPRAYEALVDRLLASPHYGERWGRHWLDQARYADSNGYTIDGEREVWPYRDWVIQALNSDMPFDRFTIEQLAGDLLPGAGKSQLVATGFHRNTLINQEGGTDPEQFRVESAMDRVNTTGAVWLGLTVGCAQCHPHKFDPISQREYYQLLAFFNSTDDVNDRGPTVPVVRGEMFGTPQTRPDERPALPPAELAALRSAWEKDELARREAAITAAAPAWTSVQYVKFTTRSDLALKLLDDNSLVADSRVAPDESYQTIALTTLPQVAAVRLRVLTDESLPKHGPGRAEDGNFMLTDFAFEVDGDEQGFSWAAADHQQTGFPVAAAIDGDIKTGWSIGVEPGSAAQMNANHEAVFVFSHPISPVGKTLLLRMYHDGPPNHLIGRFAVDFTATVPPLVPDDQDAKLLAALRTANAERTPDQVKLLQAAFERAEPRARTMDKRPQLVSALQMIMREREQPRETFTLLRGDFTRPDKAAGALEPGVLRAVPAAWKPVAPRGTRLDLARWLVDPANPLTPRVTMNRVWMRYFGRGLVESDEDFGAQGSAPTHPALLDWLAGEFIRSDWSQKQMHQLIVTSATYRQASRQTAAALERDPRNLLLARQSRLRLEAEIVRDAALSASGLLDATIGGPSVHPPQPDGVYAFTQLAKQWKTDTGGARYRRALYTFFYRSAPYPLFGTFDAPDFQTACTRRPRSNTPLQSLTVANDAAFVELAQGLALRLTKDVPAGALLAETSAALDAVQLLDARIRRASLLTLSREPSATEYELLRTFVVRERDAFAQNPDAAALLVTPELTAAVSQADGAALVCLARALLNTDNFITRE